MSDEKKPFAVVDEDAGIIRVAGIDVSHGVRRSDVTDINAAVERERREAAVKALRQVMAWFLFDHPNFMWHAETMQPIKQRFTLDEVLLALQTYTDKIERGEP